jgi:hypothetical protein
MSSAKNEDKWEKIYSIRFYILVFSLGMSDPTLPKVILILKPIFSTVFENG